MAVYAGALLGGPSNVQASAGLHPRNGWGGHCKYRGASGGGGGGVKAPAPKTTERYQGPFISVCRAQGAHAGAPTKPPNCPTSPAYAAGEAAGMLATSCSLLSLALSPFSPLRLCASFPLRIGSFVVGAAAKPQAAAAPAAGLELAPGVRALRRCAPVLPYLGMVERSMYILSTSKPFQAACISCAGSGSKREGGGVSGAEGQRAGLGCKRQQQRTLRP